MSRLSGSLFASLSPSLCSPVLALDSGHLSLCGIVLPHKSTSHSATFPQAASRGLTGSTLPCRIPERHRAEPAHPRAFAGSSRWRSPHYVNCLIEFPITRQPAQNIPKQPSTLSSRTRSGYVCIPSPPASPAPQRGDRQNLGSITQARSLLCWPQRGAGGGPTKENGLGCYYPPCSPSSVPSPLIYASHYHASVLSAPAFGLFYCKPSAINNH